MNKKQERVNQILARHLIKKYGLIELQTRLKKATNQNLTYDTRRYQNEALENDMYQMLHNLCMRNDVHIPTLFDELRRFVQFYT